MGTNHDVDFIKKQRRQRVLIICLSKMNCLSHHLHKPVGASDSSVCDTLHPQHKKETVQHQHVLMFHHRLTCCDFLPFFCTGFYIITSTRVQSLLMLLKQVHYNHVGSVKLLLSYLASYYSLSTKTNDKRRLFVESQHKSEVILLHRLCSIYIFFLILTHQPLPFASPRH